MSNKSLIALIVGVVVAIAAWNCFYIVAQTERAVLLQFGRVVQADVQPGLHVKVPYVNQVRKFDARLMTLDAPTQRFLTLEKKAVMVDAYAKWRVKDAERFYTATSGLKQIADERLSRRLESGLRDQFGKRTLHEVVSGEREQIMARVREKVDQDLARIGVGVIDVRLKRVDLPQDVSESVYRRMEAERKRIANDLRSTGGAEAEAIRADADRQREVILANAYRDAQKTKGEGDATSAATYARAFSQNAEFYTFYRSLRAYRESFTSKSDVMVLDPSSDFFRFLEKAKP